MRFFEPTSCLSDTHESQPTTKLPALQLGALKQAGRVRVYTETASGAQRDRSELKAALDNSVPATRSSSGGSIRLAQSMKQLARGRTGGRSPVLDEKEKAAALPLLRDPSIPVREVARRLGISAAALYHHFSRCRGAVLENTTTKT